MAYCTSDEVKILIYGEANSYDKPTNAQITAIIADIDNEINARLVMIGVTPSAITNATALGELKKFSKFGSAGTVGTTLLSNSETIIGFQSDWYYSKYEEFLSNLIENQEYYKKLFIGTYGSGASVSSNVIDGTITETEALSNMLGNEQLG